nr:hypothetical protein [Mesorhizobium sp.]
MANSAPPSLGILTLECGLPPDQWEWVHLPNSVFNQATFEFPIISEIVPGAWPDRVIPGDPHLEPHYITAAKRLIQRGAVAITGDCGFTIRYQTAIAASVRVPVAMSSLLLVPMLLRQLPPATKLAVVTADSAHCGEDLLGINGEIDRARIVVGGIEGGTLWQNEMKRPSQPTSVAEIEADVAACVARLRAANPDVAAILFECTMFPTVAPAIRSMTGLPVYDTATLYRMTFASVGERKT